MNNNKVLIVSCQHGLINLPKKHEHVFVPLQQEKKQEQFE